MSRPEIEPTRDPRPADGARSGASASSDDAPVPRLPRGRGIKLSGIELFRIGGLAMVLVVLLLLQRPCANAVATFVTGFGDRGSAASQLPRPGALDTAGPGTRETPGAQDGATSGPAVDTDPLHYERLRPGMSEEEIKAAIERARRRAGTADP